MAFCSPGFGVFATARRLGAAAAFLFAYRVMPTAMVTFTAFTYARSRCPTRTAPVCSSISSWAARRGDGGVRSNSAAWRSAVDDVRGRAFADAVLGLGRLIVVQADRRRDGGNRAAARADGCAGRQRCVDVVWSDGGVHAVLALAARCAPRGLEATGYSALLFVADLATGVGSLLAAEFFAIDGPRRG